MGMDATSCRATFDSVVAVFGSFAGGESACDAAMKTCRKVRVEGSAVRSDLLK